ncbi:hypothetical protein [Ferruginibacter sp.]
MKKISYWAGANIIPARILIVLLKIILLALAYYTGIALYRLQVLLPAGTVYCIALSLLVTAIVFYPSKQKRRSSTRLAYIKQKTCDFILPVCSFVVIATMVNNGDNSALYSTSQGSAIIKRTAALEILASGKTKDALSKKEKKVLKKEFVKQLKMFAAAKVKGDKKAGDDAWKIMLAIVAALGVAYLLGALVCSLSCSGSDTAAIIVALLGTVGLIWGLVVLIKHIKRGPKTTKAG